MYSSLHNIRTNLCILLIQWQELWARDAIIYQKPHQINRLGVCALRELQRVALFLLQDFALALLVGLDFATRDEQPLGSLESL